MAGVVPTARVAAERGVPWVLDPTAIGLAPVRTPLAHELLALGPSIVRGNASEVLVLAGGGQPGRGADSTVAPDAAAEAAHSLAAAHGCVVAVSGAVDLVTDGRQSVRIASGAPVLTRVTGTGCLLGALTAAHAAVAAPFVAAVAATALLTVASERVGGLGPGSFRVGLLDALDGPEEFGLRTVVYGAAPITPAAARLIRVSAAVLFIIPRARAASTA